MNKKPHIWFSTRLGWCGDWRVSPHYYCSVSQCKSPAQAVAALRNFGPVQ